MLLLLLSLSARFISVLLSSSHLWRVLFCYLPYRAETGDALREGQFQIDSHYIYRLTLYICIFLASFGSGSGSGLACVFIN